jgi:hypothetical protein
MSKHHTDNLPRCRYRTSTGRRCRSRASGATSRLCPRHTASEARLDSADLTAALASGRDHSFQSAECINDSLGKLFTLLAADRISPRRAAVLAYIGSLLLRSLPAIEKENAPADPKNARPTIIWDIPGFPREPTAVHEQKPPAVSE